MSIADKLTAIAENEPRVWQSGYNQGFASGRYEERQKFWDIFQNNGNGISYCYAFANGRFTDENYKPIHNIVCRDTATSDAQQMFYNTAITDTLVPIQIGKDKPLTQTFQNSTNLVTINKLIVTDGSTYPSAFNGCSSLQNITFEGIIGQNISFANSSKLTIESLRSIIDALKTTSATLTLTLHADAKARLTDADKATITQKGWTLA
jgi:hypothetical protein